MAALGVLVVADSALMRRHLVQLLQAEKGLRVRSARNGQEALAMVESFDPQVVTLDVNMPEMDGITCLARIMVGSPRAVIMVSSITEAGAEAPLQALRLGAFDYLQKPGGTISLSLDQVAEELVRKIRLAAKSGRAGAKRMAAPAVPAAAPPVPAPMPIRSNVAPMRDTAAQAGDPAGLVVIGVSTGGPHALEQILPGLPGHLPWPVLVAQHMPRSFTGVFARRLDKLCALNVRKVASQTDPVRGNIDIARGNADMLVVRRNRSLHLHPDVIQRIKHREVFVLRDEVVPLIRMTALLGGKPAALDADRGEAVLVCRVEGRTVGLVIDDFREGMDVILKPMTGLLAEISGYGGTTLLGDGRVLLVLDLKALL